VFRLLIVDDEPDIVEGLLAYFKNLESMELDFYTAYSGFEALDILNSTKIDIMLTDILMPGMSGLQLLEKVQAGWPYCRVIFLTGHDEFEYVYQAIRYDSVGYILKTEGFEEIGAAVAKAAVQLENSLRISELKQKAEEYMNTALPFMQREYITDLVKGEGCSLVTRIQQFHELRIPLDCNKPVLLLIGRIHDYDRSILPYDKSRLHIMLQNIMPQCFSQTLSIFFTPIERHTLLWLIQPFHLEGNVANQVKGSAEAMQNICLDQLKASISFIVDSDMVSWEDLPDRYEYLKINLYTRLEPGTNVLLISQVPAMGSKQHQNLYYYRRVKSLEMYLENSQKEQFFQTFSDLQQSLETAEYAHGNPAMEVYYAISLMYLAYINRYGLVDVISCQISLDRLFRIEEHTAWKDAISYLRRLAEIIFDLKAKELSQIIGSPIDRVMAYVNNHINEDISLAKLADLVYFNPSYLSRLFKQTTGINLLAYINKIRIEKAKKLLQESNMKIHEISSSVGYESASYFTQFFRRNVQMSPQEYRDMFSK
jgi:two-component system response regulator YesN